ncbi:MAG: hypothetical protein ACI3VZ_08300 [Faecousia sp.]
MKDDFEFLRGLANCQDKEQMARCIEEHQQKPMTNAQKIRSMSDEELCQLLMKFVPCDFVECDRYSYDCDECDECIMKWLKQKAEGE